MTAVFNHSYELYVSIPNQKILAQQVCSTGYDSVIPIDVSQPLVIRKSITAKNTPLDYTVESTSAIIIKEPIQIEANIDYMMKSSSSSGKSGATIKIYELSDDTNSKIVKEGMVILKGGYKTDSELPTVFVGTIDRVTKNKNITTILAKEAGSLLKNAVINRMFSENQTRGDIFRGLAKEFSYKGVPLGRFDETPRTKAVLGSTFITSGNLKERLTTLCKALDYNWYISKNRLYITPKEVDIIVDTLYVTEDNVIGSIQLLDESSNASTNSNTTRNFGIKFETFLNGNIGLETPIYITYGKYKGIYKITGLNVSMNYKSGPWKHTIEAMEAKK